MSDIAKISRFENSLGNLDALNHPDFTVRSSTRYKKSVKFAQNMFSPSQFEPSTPTEPNDLRIGYVDRMRSHSLLVLGFN